MPHPIAGVSSQVVGFVGLSQNFVQPVTLASFADFSRALDALAGHELALLCSRICILHAPAPSIPIATHHPPVNSAYAAYYYPWLTVADGKSSRTIPPSGQVAALTARNASVALAGVQGLSQTIGSIDSNALSARTAARIPTTPPLSAVVRCWAARRTKPSSYVPIKQP